MKRTIVLALAASLAFVSIASAQPKKKAPPPADKPIKHKVIDITDGDDIVGGTPGHELVPIGVREAATSSSLIRIRHDFIDLILKVAEDMS